MTLEQLHRIRRGARAALTLGVVVSILANILHANGNPISQSIAAWAPVALLITIELIARVPIRRGLLSLARLLATATIAGIAAWVSYWHMVGVALRYGEEPGAAHLIPLTVDGLVVVAWVCLVEVGGRIRDAQTEGASDVRQQERQERQELLPAASGDAAGLGEADQGRGGAPATGAPGEGIREVGAAAEGAGEALTEGVKLTPARKPPPTAAERVTRAHKRNPDASHAELAKRLNLSPATVKRHRPKPEPINGREPELVTAGATEKEN